MRTGSHLSRRRLGSLARVLLLVSTVLTIAAAACVVSFDGYNDAATPPEAADVRDTGALDGGDAAPLTSCEAQGEFRDAVTKRCYRIGSTPRAWNAADGDCKNWADGGRLAAIQRAELGLVQDNVRIDAGDAIWIGGHFADGGWGWTNGELWEEPAPWFLGQPGAAGECVKLIEGSRFRDESCGTLFRFLCERAP